nr:hypothetical protein [Clostridium sp. Marseille-P7770]
MDKQTFDYVSLKPIADRFKKVAETISDYEIRDIIKAQIAEKVKEQLADSSFPLEQIIEDWFDDETHVDWVNKTLKDSIKIKLFDNKFR